MNPWLEGDKKHMEVMCIKILLVNRKGEVDCPLESYENILEQTHEGELVLRAVLKGLAGIGKTTLFAKIAYDWSSKDPSKMLQKYELVFLLKICYLEQSSNLIDAVFDQLLDEDTDIDKSALDSYIKKNSSKVLILLDGFDEMKTTSLVASSFGSILKMLNRKMYRDCTVLVSTRSSHFDKLVAKELVQEPFTHVNVEGFDEKRLREYVSKYFGGKQNKIRGLMKEIKASKPLTTLAKYPMLLLLMCILWADESKLPETMSCLYRKG
jgi:hypothetical protein